MTTSLFSSVRFVSLSLLCLASGCTDDAPTAGMDEEMEAMTLGAPQRARAVRNATVEVPVTIERTGFDGDVTIEVSGLPSGVSAGAATIPAGATTGTLSLSADAAAQLASRTAVTLHATAGDVGVEAAMEVLVADPAGTLDTTFDVDGKVLGDLAGGGDDVIMSMVRQQSGIVVVANDLTSKAVRWARIDNAGQPDPTFAALLAESGSRVNTNAGLQQRADGSLVLAYLRGEGWESEVIVRGFDANGNVLTGFGGNPYSRLSMKYAELDIIPTRVTLAKGPDGTLYLAASGDGSVKIARLQDDGTIDPTFGTEGFITVSAIEMIDMSVDPMGRFVVAGYINMDRSVVRVTSTGELDSAFSTDGRVTIAGGYSESFAGPVFLSGDRTLMALGFGGMQGMAMVDTAGEPVNAFGVDGQIENLGYPLRMTTYGDDIVAGSGNDSLFSYGFVLHRRSAITGEPAPGFGENGQITIDFAPSRATANAILIDDLGRAVLGGWRQDGSDYDSTVLRIWL